MTALDTIMNIVNTETLYKASLKYCLVSKDKLPYKMSGDCAKPNVVEDFVSLDELLLSNDLEDYAGIGISIQASNVCAIDVDKCFSIPFDIDSADDRAKDTIETFKDLAYIEFSFSGKGLRVLFRQKLINDYTKKYYIKNEKSDIEYYQPSQSYRYVTLTGKTISNNYVDSSKDFMNVILAYLDKYMTRPIRHKEVKIIEDDKTVEQLMKEVKIHCFKNHVFQDLWFSKAPGSGKDESERDFYLISYIYENITQNKEKLKYVFEQSPFFKSKDYHHVDKWLKQDYRYFDYLYEHIRRK